MKQNLQRRIDEFKIEDYQHHTDADAAVQAPIDEWNQYQEEFRCPDEGTRFHDAVQRRAEGLNGLNEATGPLFKIRDDPRLTHVGKFIRRTSLDELPQFFNVLKGEMSLVGPRPPITSEVEQYADWHKQRLEVSPGVTGLWQVSGRSELTFDEMVMLDIYYIENWSPWMDFWILVKTVPTVLLARGAY